MRLISASILLLTSLQASCVVVGGYRSGDGWFFWPGGLGLLVAAAILLLLVRRRR